MWLKFRQGLCVIWETVHYVKKTMSTWTLSWMKLFLDDFFAVSIVLLFNCISRSPNIDMRALAWVMTWRRTATEQLFNNDEEVRHPTLRWRHNDHNGVSNHQPHDCLLSRLFRRRSKKTSKLRVTGLCVGNSPGPVNSPHKGPVTRKMFPFDDVIMEQPLNNYSIMMRKFSTLNMRYLTRKI